MTRNRQCALKEFNGLALLDLKARVERPPQRKPRGRHPNNALTPVFVRNVSWAGRYCDGQGLYLDVRPTGSRGWIQRLTIRGRRTELGLGGFPLVSLKEAREKAFANRKLARDGGDLLAEKRRAESMPTFAEATRQVWTQLRPGWRSAQHAQLWMSSLKRFAFPRIGGMPISEVTSADVIGILAPIWHDKATTARKLRQRIRAVMEWAVAMDLRPDNPCDRIAPVLGAHRNVVRHMRALPHGEVASAIEKVRGSNSGPVVKLAFELLVLTATRSGEVRGAVWTEIDRDEGVWTIPAERTKGSREHRVPLSGRALEILEEARSVGRGSPLVFPSARGKPLGNTSLWDLLRGLKIAAVPHGFRSSFRDWGGRGNRSSTRGGGGGAGAQGPQPGRGRVPSHGSVRAAASADERLGRVSGRRASRAGGRSQPLRREPLRPDPRPIHGWLMTP